MRQNYPWSASSNAVTSNASTSAQKNAVSTITGAGPFVSGQALTASALNAALSSVKAMSSVNGLQSEMKFGEDSFIKFTAPPPNWLRRLIWKWALGVTWKDLRPENDLETLRRLK